MSKTINSRSANKSDRDIPSYEIGREELELEKITLTKEEIEDAEISERFQEAPMKLFVEFLSAGLPDRFLGSHPELGKEENLNKIEEAIQTIRDPVLKKFLLSRLKAIKDFQAKEETKQKNEIKETKVTLLFTNPKTRQSYEVTLPSDKPVKKLIGALITTLDLDTQDSDGNLLEWTLYHRESKATLANDDTLKSSGVSEEDEIYLISKPEKNIEPPPHAEQKKEPENDEKGKKIGKPPANLNYPDDESSDPFDVIRKKLKNSQ